jgi:hypothetical protein
MKTLINNRFFLVLCALGGAAAAGCSSSSSSNDGGLDLSLDIASDAATLYGLTPGAWCYTINSATNVDDGCGIGVGALVGMSLPTTYTLVGNTGTLEVGTDGSLGQGTISNNMGTLARDNNPMLDTMPTCTWHQTDTSDVTLTATNAFTVSVTEVQEGFASVCSVSNVPSGGSCTSTWTWTMAISATGDAGAGCN